MMYEVTATRKRPTSFDDLTGQEFVVATLRNSLSSGRLAHAYLFSGPRGVGKTSAARILARALNCPSGPTAEPCEDYPGSQEITRGTSLDVIEIDGASNTSVNDVREIKDEVLFAPNSSRYKIYIIDEVHMLSNSAFNALLKTIEEPPPYIVFIFATTEIHKVPATIRSRCQQFSFRLIPLEAIRARLREVCGELGLDAEEEALFWMAKEARGSLRDAYTLFDQVAAFSDGHISFDRIRRTLGVGSIEQMNDLGEAFVAGDGGRALDLLAAIMDAGISEEQVAGDLAEYFRNVLFLKHGVRKQSVLGYPPERFSGAVIDGFSEEQIEHALGLLVELFRNMRYSVNPRYELELVISRLAALAGYLSSARILERIEQLKRELGAAGSTGAVGSGDDAIRRPESPHGAATRLSAGPESPGRHGTSTETPAVPPAVSGAASAGGRSAEPRAAVRQVEAEKIEEIVTALRARKPTLASVLEHALAWDLGESELLISVDGAFAAGSIEAELATVREVVCAALDEPVTVSVVARARSSEEQAQHGEQVEMVRQVFRGEVLDGQGEQR
ncbi:MAG: DNA polymerase III subunit gamma/tau [Spirochaetaceae bacterium]|nr:MAG: DNA polymerase III subunit gamma/tau [Spirochaetaceae bacterium]